jgi:hypothetical protein
VNAIARAKEQHRIAPIGSRTRRWIDLRNTVAATLAAELNPDSTSEVPGAGGTIVAARKRQGRVLSGLPTLASCGRDTSNGHARTGGAEDGINSTGERQ